MKNLEEINLNDEIIKDGVCYRKIIIPPTFRIHVHNARGLSRIGLLHSKPSPYAKAKWNKDEIGRSEVFKKTTEPRFEMDFDGIMNNDMKLNDMLLEVEVWDLEERLNKARNKHRFLGRATLSGPELFYLNGLHTTATERRRERRASVLIEKDDEESKEALLKLQKAIQEDDDIDFEADDISDDGKNTSMSVELMMADDLDLDGDAQNLVGGRVEISGFMDKERIKWIEDEDEEDLNIFADKMKQDDLMAVTTDDHTASTGTSEGLIEALKGGVPSGVTDMLEIVVYAAKGLARADLFRASNPFVQVTINDRLVGSTEMQIQTTNPRWDHERIILPVMRGLKARSVKIKIEIFSENLRTDELSFLGEVEFKNEEVVKLLGGRCSKHEHLGNNREDGKGSIRSLPSWHKLKTSMSRTLIQNKLVQGEIMLSGSYRPDSFHLEDVTLSDDHIASDMNATNSGGGRSPGLKMQSIKESDYDDTIDGTNTESDSLASTGIDDGSEADSDIIRMNADGVLSAANAGKNTRRFRLSTFKAPQQISMNLHRFGTNSSNAAATNTTTTLTDTDTNTSINGIDGTIKGFDPSLRANISENRIALYISAAWGLIDRCQDVFCNVRLDGHTVARTPVVKTLESNARRYSISMQMTMRRQFTFDYRAVFPVDWDDITDKPFFNVIEVSLYGSMPNILNPVFLGCTLLSVSDLMKLQNLHDREHDIMDLQETDFLDHQPYVTGTGKLAVRAKYQKCEFSPDTDLALATIDVSILEANGLELRQRFKEIWRHEKALRTRSNMNAANNTNTNTDVNTTSTNDATSSSTLSITNTEDDFQEFESQQSRKVWAYVIWNGNAIGRHEVAVDVDTPVSELDIPNFRVTVPRDMDLTDCRLHIELYLDRPFSGVARGGFYLGRAELTGRFLERYVGADAESQRATSRASSRGGRRRTPDQWLELFPSPYEEEEVNERITGGIKIACNYIPADNSVVDKSMQVSVEPEPEPVPTLAGEIKRRQSILGMFDTKALAASREEEIDPGVKLIVTIIGAKHLSKPSKFGRTNAMVRLVWNGVPIATTGFVKDNNNPVWPDCESFHLRVPRGWHLAECTLTLQIYDQLRSYDASKYVGEVTITHEELQKLIKKTRSAVTGVVPSFPYDVKCTKTVTVEDKKGKKKDVSRLELMGQVMVNANLMSVSNDRGMLNRHIRKSVIEAGDLLHVSKEASRGKDTGNLDGLEPADIGQVESKRERRKSKAINKKGKKAGKEEHIAASHVPFQSVPFSGTSTGGSGTGTGREPDSVSRAIVPHQHYHHQTSSAKKSGTFIVPAANVPQYTAPPTHDFEKAIDPESGRWYYYDKISGQTTWDVPPGDIIQPLTEKQIKHQQEMREASARALERIHHIRTTVVAQNNIIMAAEENRRKAAEKDKKKKQERMIWHKAIIEGVELKGEINLSWQKFEYGIAPGVYSFEKDFPMRMRALRLVGLGLTELPEELFANLQNLEALVLSSNKLKYLPENIARLTDLTELTLLNNELEYLPKEIGFMCSLEKLELASNKLGYLPATFAALSKLDRIDLESNLLKILPENLESLFNCRTLNLNHNILVRLPRCIGRMPSLTALSASTNAIQYIPKEITTSKTLKVIRINNNMLSALPYRIGDLKKLKELSVCYNDIHELPITFYMLGKLTMLRLEGNRISLPEEDIINRGAKAVVQWCRERFLHDEQARMRVIVNETQLLMTEVAKLGPGFYDESLFRPPFDVENDTWFGLQFDYLLDELIPEMKRRWRETAYKRKDNKKSNNHKEFPYSKQEVMWAWTQYSDAQGPVMRKQECWFTICSCVDENGRRKPCVPPKHGFMCNRIATLMKSNVVLKRQRQERLWNAFIDNGVQDAVRRAEKEAVDYLETSEGSLWLTQLSYEKAEEMVSETGAMRALKWRDRLAETKKNKVIRRYARLKARVERVRDKKMQGLKSDLEKVKSELQSARQGYIRKTLESRRDFISLSMSTLQENLHLKRLQEACDKEVEIVEAEVFEISSDESSTDSELDDEEDRARKRNARQKKLQDDLAAGGNKNKSEIDTLKKEIPALHPQHIFEQIYETSVTEYKKLSSKMGSEKPAPIGSWRYSYRSRKKKLKKVMQTAVDIADSKLRQIVMKGSGNFDETQKEMRYELYHQYVEHAKTVARRKAEGEFKAMAKIRRGWAGAGMRESFAEWKFWVQNKQRRRRRDLRYQWRRMYRAFMSGMESVTIAEAQVLLWSRENDSFTDTPFWRHSLTGEITWDKPNIMMYLPAHFEIPSPPDPLPPDVSIDDSDDEKERMAAKSKGIEFKPKGKVIPDKIRSPDSKAPRDNDDSDADDESDEQNTANRDDDSDSDGSTLETGTIDNSSLNNSVTTSNFEGTSVGGNDTMGNDFLKAAMGTGGSQLDTTRPSSSKNNNGDGGSPNSTISKNSKLTKVGTGVYNEWGDEVMEYYAEEHINANIADEQLVRDGIRGIKDWKLIGEAKIASDNGTLDQFDDDHSTMSHISHGTHNTRETHHSHKSHHKVVTSFTYGPDSIRASDLNRNALARKPIFQEEDYGTGKEYTGLPKEVEDKLVAAKTYMLTDEYKDLVEVMPDVDKTDLDILKEQKIDSTEKEYLLAHAAITKKRANFSKARHDTYMRQITRNKTRTFDENQARKKKVVIEEKKYVKPSVKELLEIAGGDEFIVNDSSEEAMKVRNLLAARALKAKSRIRERAVDAGLTKPKAFDFWGRYIAPIWREDYISSSDEEDDHDAAKQAVMEAKKKNQDAAQSLANKWKSKHDEGGD